jgi:ArsR family transcriptional regulator, arsenate/arsenite/antimonite-responsive transcriptional repressor
MKVMAFTDQQKHRARLYKALSHPARLAILEYLAEIKTCITGDIADELPLSRTTVNQHLKELKDAGLIQGTVEGVRTNYCLNPSAIEELRNEFNEFFRKIHSDAPIC